MAQKSNDNKTTTFEISSACMVDGNEMPTSEAALFARMIVLNFEDNQFSKEATAAYKILSEQKDKGFCQITRDLLKFRGLFEEKFKSEFEKIFSQIKPKLTIEMEISDRQLRHIVLLLVPVKLLQQKIDFPFHYKYYEDAVIENAKNQNVLAHDIKDVTIFWSAFAFKISDPYSGIKEGTHYQIDPVKRIIFIKDKLFYPHYVDYAKKNNLRILSHGSLRALLTSKSNKSFIPNTTQKSRPGNTYTHPNFGCCYMFKYDSAENSKAIIVNSVEVNLCNK